MNESGKDKARYKISTAFLPKALSNIIFYREQGEVVTVTHIRLLIKQ